MSIWYDEIHRDSMRFGLKATQTLHSSRSDFQKIDIVDTEVFGRALLLDDLWMLSELDERAYHELLAHPALTTCPEPSRVLIIGGGDGGTAREVLRHPEVDEVTLVEIDPEVIAACKRHLPTLGAGAWDDPRLHVQCDDGAAFLAAAPPASYDVILIDGSDPVGPAAVLFSEEFLSSCASALSPGGVLALQAESPTLHRDVHLDTIARLRQTFEVVAPYYGVVSVYPGGAWSWIYASHGVRHDQPIEARVARLEDATEHYHRGTHHAAFVPPNHIRRALRGA
jgi:spermidine synthase